MSEVRKRCSGPMKSLQVLNFSVADVLMESIVGRERRYIVTESWMLGQILLSRRDGGLELKKLNVHIS